MSPRSGNAWAVMKAREKKKQQLERQQQQSTDSEKVSTSITHKPPILDYPSSITSRESSFSSSHDAKLDPSSHHAQNQDQVSSSSFVGTTTEADSPREKDQRVENEVNRSRVAALRTKFSLKDIGEARREQGGSGLSGDDGPYSGTTTLQNSFDEDVLVPEKSDSGVYALSAPGSQVPSGDDLHLAAQLSMEDGDSLEKIRNAMNAKKRTKLGNAMEDDANEQIDAMILEATQAPTARKGQYLNSGQAEVIKTEASAQSLRAVRDESTPEPFPGIHDSNVSQSEMSSPIPSLSLYQPTSSNSRGNTLPNTTTHGGSAPSPPDPTYNNTITLDQQLHSHVQALHHHLNSVVSRLTKTFESSNNWTMDQILRNVEVLSDTARVMNARSVGLGESVCGAQRGLQELGERVEVLRGEIRGVEARLVDIVREEVGRLRGELGLGSLIDSSSVMGVPVMTGAKQLHPKEQDVSGGEHNKGTNNPTEKDGMVQVKPGTPLPTTPVQKKETTNPQRSGSSGRKNPARESSGSPEPRPTFDRSFSLDAVSENSQSTLQPLQKQKTDCSAPSEEGTKTPHKKSMFGFRRRRDTGDNQSSSFSSSRFLRTPRRNKDKNKDKDANSNNKALSEDLKKTTSASDSTIAPPSTPPVPKVPANLAQPQPQPQHQRAPHLQPSTNDQNMSPSAIHPALRNPRQQQIMREREQRLHHQQTRLQQLNHNYRANQFPSSSTSMALIPQRSLRGSRSHQGFRSKVSAASSASLFNPGGLVARRSPSALSVRMDSDMGYHGLPHYQPNARYISSSGSYLPEPPRFGGRGGLQGHIQGHRHGQGHGRPLASREVSSSSVVSRTGRGAGPMGSSRGSAEG
ncbi:uncharacterized protein ASPGLDRAFT_21937 [Aspergillus glaucus CBS 516.65]|uniref:Uncharacterized protein n=1 Tax=Aspergillus glaucus CBS 516.65 TaxID=1160497 RepID=A0A1L9VWX4_ASPGL|nr:hypothetical protein ASPGLDRAFT_21937 [Aspergillus glaucus CBS 516.65]OJJ88399.1 hypothetical protein ASPGLDRAFT_21937 [Aspergillus glaucus CBS 516.65]